MITDDQIYQYLLGDNIIISEMYQSPIPIEHRKPDTADSFGLYIKNDDGIIRWKDFGLADQQGNRAIDLVKYMKGFPVDEKGYYPAKKFVETEITRNYFGKSVVELKKASRVGKGTLPYITWNDGYTDFEMEYMDRFSFTESELRQEQVYGLKSLHWVGDHVGRETHSVTGDPAFVYLFRQNPVSWKLYRPLAKDITRKFRQWNIENIIEGGHTLPVAKQPLLIITSSTKDRLVYKHLKHWSLNPSAESAYVTFIRNKERLKQLADRIVVMNDGDEAGFKTGTVMATHLGCENIDMRNKLGSWKDPSDFVDKLRGKHSYDELDSIINKLLK